MTDIEKEIQRARGVYAARAGNPTLSRLYSPFAQSALLTIQDREWIIADLMRRSGIWSLAEMDILDVGCGSGGELRRMATYGADPARMAGLDLMESRVEEARKVMPGARFEVGSAHEMPFPDASFDLVTQFVLFSSVVNRELRGAIAAEMVRVLRPEGRIIWYDIKSMKPNPNLVPIDLKELRELFPGCTITVRKATLGWWPSHFMARRSHVVSILLTKLPRMRSHYVALIRKAEADRGV